MSLSGVWMISYIYKRTLVLGADLAEACMDSLHMNAAIFTSRQLQATMQKCGMLVGEENVVEDELEASVDN